MNKFKASSHRVPNLLVRLKPCLMMSPLAVEKDPHVVSVAYEIGLGDASYLSNVLRSFPAGRFNSKSFNGLISIDDEWRSNLMWFRNDDAFRSDDWRERTKSCANVADWPEAMFGTSQVVTLLPT